MTDEERNNKALEYIRSLGIDPDTVVITKVGASQWGREDDGQRESLRVEFEPIYPALPEDPGCWSDDQIEAIREVLGTPTVPPIPRAPDGDGAEVDLVIPLFDLHIGCREAPQTQQEIEARWLSHLIDRLHERRDHIVILLGGDLLHADSVKGETTKGTKLEDVVLPPDRARALLLYFVDALVQACLAGGDAFRHVQLIGFGGNHDWNSSGWLATTLEQRYHGLDLPIEVEFGVDGFAGFRMMDMAGFAMHGHVAGPDKVALLAANLHPNLWRRRNRYAWVGHQHRRAVDDTKGVTVFQVPAPVQRNDWSRAQLHIPSIPAFQLFEFMDGELQSIQEIRV